MSKKIQTIMTRVQNSPWAILPEKLAEIIEFLTIRAENGEIDFSDLKAVEEIRPKVQGRNTAEVQGTVAIIPIRGTIFPKANLMTEYSGGTSAQKLEDEILEAVDNPKVKSILLEIDSAGGSVYGINEVASTILANRDQKPIVAMAHHMAASAAYWIGSAASEFVVSPSGEVGSIGVLVVHEDISQASENEGRKTTIIKSSKYKAEANPFEPLSEEAAEELQRKVNIYDQAFVSSVAKGRGLPVKTVKSEFGQGRMLTASEAIGRRMVDRVATLAETLGRLESPHARARIGRKAELTESEFRAGIIETFGISKSKAKMIARDGFKESLWSSEDNAVESERNADYLDVESVRTAIVSETESVRTVSEINSMLKTITQLTKGK